MNILRKVKKVVKSALAKEERYILYNVFNRGYAKRVLVSYITEPFATGVNNRHTNLLECYTACEIFDELKYNVDVIDYNKYDSAISYDDYDVIYGFGVSMEKSFVMNGNPFLKRIIYATGCDTVFSNSAGLLRVNEFYKKHGLLCLSSARLVDSTWRIQIAFSDLIIALGNNFVKKTYEIANYTKSSSLNLFYKEEALECQQYNKDFNVSKRNFLWWGSLGAIHKGLDLLLEYFSQNPELNLYICGYKTEHPFDLYYRKVIEKNKNIMDMGFVTIGSDKYHDLLAKCAASVLPSASEGGAAGIINVCSNANIIPIVTKSCGLDLPVSAEKYIIDSLDLDGIASAIGLFVSSSSEDLSKISKDVTTHFQNNYSYDTYKKNLTSLIESVL
jgi:glycosyltransferase involved in cell wall biosynthesis